MYIYTCLYVRILFKKIVGIHEVYSKKLAVKNHNTEAQEIHCVSENLEKPERRRRRRRKNGCPDFINGTNSRD